MEANPRKAAILMVASKAVPRRDTVVLLVKEEAHTVASTAAAPPVATDRCSRLWATDSKNNKPAATAARWVDRRAAMAARAADRAVDQPVAEAEGSHPSRTPLPGIKHPTRDSSFLILQLSRTLF